MQCMSCVSAESHVEQSGKGCVSVFLDSRSFSSVLAAGHSRLIVRQFFTHTSFEAVQASITLQHNILHFLC